MARPKGTKNIETPEILWQHFIDYRNEVKSNPRERSVFVGKDGFERREPLERPLTMEGFDNYCFEKGITGNIQDYFANTKDLYTDYSSVCTRIRASIRQDQIEGGMVGQYNHSITQRLNNLTDKVEQTNITQPLFPDVPEDNSNK